MKYYCEDSQQVLQELNSQKSGLTEKEAAERLLQNGANELNAAKGKSLLRRFAEQVADPMIVILLAAAQAGLPIYEYTPMQVKQAVTGYGKAVKKQVQEMTRVLLHLPAVPKPDDTADALAMAITFCHTNGNQLNRFVRRVAGPI